MIPCRGQEGWTGAGMEIGRRGVFRLAGSATGAWPLAARSQQGSSRPIVAVLVPLSLAQTRLRVEAVRKGLGEAGLLEGTHYVLEFRSSDGQTDRLPALARELQSLRPVSADTETPSLAT